MDEVLERRPLWTHLDELLLRSRRSVFWLLLGSIVGYVLAPRCVALLSAPLLERLPEGAHLVYTAPFEKIWSYLRVAMIVGVAVASPLFAWELGSFVRPALHRRERRRILQLSFWGLLAFGIGVSIGYLWVLPALLDMLLQFGGGAEWPMLTLSRYVDAALGVLLLCALFMEIPVIMIHCSAWNWVDAAVWSRGRRLAIVVNAVLSAILSPPDALSMIAMLVPLQLLYEIGILGARMAQWMAHERKNS